MAGTEAGTDAGQAGQAGRVLIVLASAQRRGAEVEGSQLAAQLVAVGVDARVVALHPGGGAAAGKSAAAGRSAAAEQLLDAPVLGERPLSWATLRGLRREAASTDVVIAYGSSALPACALALTGCRTPFVYRSIGDPGRWLRGRLHRWRTARLFRRAAHVVALWPAAAEAIVRLHGVPAASVSTIPNARPMPAGAPGGAADTGAGDGADAAHGRARARAALEVPDDALVVAWVGALSAEKRPLAAVRAVAALGPPAAGFPPAWLVLAGAGALAAEVEAECERLLPGRHRLLGVVQLPPVWAAADLVLLTSATEGMPGVLIEAALHRVPAVATDVGAVASIVTDGAGGRLVPAAAGPAELAAAIREVAGRARTMGDFAAAHVAARFTWQVVVPQWQQMLGEVAARRGNPGR
ncbi:MAG: glycosyltransferase family 4 protein [Actinomycetota bacterium]|nr:glycosyltransferase family 4 protein [Actinomycetota bacterium]